MQCHTLPSGYSYIQSTFWHVPPEGRIPRCKGIILHDCRLYHFYQIRSKAFLKWLFCQFGPTGYRWNGTWTLKVSSPDIEIVWISCLQIDRNGVFGGEVTFKSDEGIRAHLKAVNYKCWDVPDLWAIYGPP